MDLFASRINNQLPRYLNRYPIVEPWQQLSSCWIGANGPYLSIHQLSWSHEFYSNSTDEAGQGNRSDDCPSMARTTLDPDLLEMLVDYPARLPVSPWTIFLPFSQEEVHPLWRTLQLAVWPILRHVSKQQDFQKKCAKFSWHHREEVLRNGTRDHGNYDQAGVFNGRSVHFQLLHVMDILTFLTEQFNSRSLAYRTIGVYKACI